MNQKVLFHTYDWNKDFYSDLTQKYLSNSSVTFEIVFGFDVNIGHSYKVKTSLEDNKGQINVFKKETDSSYNTCAWCNKTLICDLILLILWDLCNDISFLRMDTEKWFMVCLKMLTD